LKVTNYFDAVDHARMVREYPPGEAFTRTVTRMSRDALRALQNERFLKVLERAWRVPFYCRLWGAAGVEPGDVRSLDDIARLPTYSKAELMQSVAEHPPFGDFHGLDTYTGERPPVVVHTTSGTTGTPQPLFFGAWSRELQNLMLARAYTMHGVRADDVVHSVYGHGLVNGGHYVRETVLHFIGAILLTAGTGVETRSKTQVELMRSFGTTVILGFPDYIRHLGHLAREMGLEPGRDIPVRLISCHLGRESRQALSEAWGGAKVFDWYGVGDTGTIGAEGPDQDGLYVMEDGHYLEILDPVTQAPLADGELGNMCDTVLFKDDIFPIVRFNTNDLSAFIPGASSLGWTLRRILPFQGRSDNMVKLRGINVYPTAIGALLEEHTDTTGEFVCIVERKADRDEMTVAVEIRPTDARTPEQQAALRELMRGKLGIDVAVDLVAPGALAALTELETRQKPLRLVDRRYR
jgi:phenylacetate-CoA ligase